MKLTLKESTERYMVTVFDPDFKPTRSSYSDFEEEDTDNIYEDIYIADDYQDAVEYAMKWYGRKNRHGNRYIITIEDEDGNEKEFNPDKAFAF
ncbi:MAG: hypothetical protein J6V44_15095 [Methanobrevibacter sp.]|nr:hypothetical protein [Methanobrevibacter sp.]MBO7696556.1 hypothetical protein [Methanobrevibacter sp.]